MLYIGTLKSVFITDRESETEKLVAFWNKMLKKKQIVLKSSRKQYWMSYNNFLSETNAFYELDFGEISSV